MINDVATDIVNVNTREEEGGVKSSKPLGA